MQYVMKNHLLCLTMLLALLTSCEGMFQPGGDSDSDTDSDKPGASIKAPEGAVKGLFTINSSGSQVFFSKGNLQYKASTDTWRFAENQWDYVGGTREKDVTISSGTVSGSDNCKISPTYSGWIDLFGWGTSGWSSGADCSNPYDSNRDADKYLPGNSMDNNLTGKYADADWGVYNAVSNGGKKAGLWRTLTSDEWEYVLNVRRGNRYAKATVNNVAGLILLPDGWDGSVYELKDMNKERASWDANIITESTWDRTLEPAGTAFLPAAGVRTAYYSQVGDGWVISIRYSREEDKPACYYWTTTSDPGKYPTLRHALFMVASWQSVNGTSTYDYNRAEGMSVRLVQDKQ
jgi:hypothetical protein